MPQHSNRFNCLQLKGILRTYHRMNDIYDTTCHPRVNGYIQFALKSCYNLFNEYGECIKRQYQEVQLHSCQKEFQDLWKCMKNIHK